MDVSMKDLRYRTTQVLQSVRRGSRPRITHRGKPVARIVPLNADDNQQWRDIGFGMWHDHATLQDVETWLDAQRAPRINR